MKVKRLLLLYKVLFNETVYIEAAPFFIINTEMLCEVGLVSLSQLVCHTKNNLFLPFLDLQENLLLFDHPLGHDLMQLS